MGVSISVNDILDNEDVKSEEEKKKKRPKATTYGKITNRSQSIRLRKVEEINLKNLRMDSNFRIDDDESPLKQIMKNMNKAQVAKYEKMLNGDAGTKSMNIPKLGFKFDLTRIDGEGLKLHKRNDSGSESDGSQGSNDIELLFPDNDHVFHHDSKNKRKEKSPVEEIKKQESKASKKSENSDHLTLQMNS